MSLKHGDLSFSDFDRSYFENQEWTDKDHEPFPLLPSPVSIPLPSPISAVEEKKLDVSLDMSQMQRVLTGIKMVFQPLHPSQVFINFYFARLCEICKELKKAGVKQIGKNGRKSPRFTSIYDSARHEALVCTQRKWSARYGSTDYPLDGVSICTYECFTFDQLASGDMYIYP